MFRDGFAAGRQIKESEAGEPLTEGKVCVKLDCNDEVIEVDIELQCNTVLHTITLANTFKQSQ